MLERPEKFCKFLQNIKFSNNDIINIFRSSSDRNSYPNIGNTIFHRAIASDCDWCILYVIKTVKSGPFGATNLTLTFHIMLY